MSRPGVPGSLLPPELDDEPRLDPDPPELPEPERLDDPLPERLAEPARRPGGAVVAAGALDAVQAGE